VDARERVRTGPARFAEPTFSYLNESGRADVWRVRAALRVGLVIIRRRTGQICWRAFEARMHARTLAPFGGLV
jgi:hypothetical protein